ncbi:MAG: winged helix-turn-helix domain-containing protein [Candidatus Krumholzibacteria bacterium]|nr:winged helix-turn-helix domain-containing protein [Candidatus Krumholzibacteria bacterium]MDH5271420.1 winged helix-turn-helix domain-containing protein [Candidatus Krumholzibacteria bacterium]
MLEAILGSASSEKVLMFLISRDQGYAREIARFFDTDVAPIQRQLEKLERGGVLVSRLAGRTRLFSFNPRYPMIDELRSLLEKTLQFYPDDVREKLTMVRRRPRRRGKPL